MKCLILKKDRGPPRSPTFRKQDKIYLKGVSMHMKLNFKRLMAMFLSIMMVVGMLPTMVFANEIDLNDSDLFDQLQGIIDGSDSADITLGYPAGVYTTNENNEKVYTSYETVADAFAAAQNGDEVAIHTAGEYSLNGIAGKNITVTGKVDGVVFTNIGAFDMGGADVTFNKVTFTYATNSTYKGLQHSGDLVYNACTINGQVFLYGESETFNNCEFNTTDSNNYNVWTYGAKEVEFNGCTFNSAGKSVLVYNEGAAHFIDLTVTETQFNASTAVDGKAAIEIDTSLTAGANITVDSATTATGFGSGNVSGNSLWNNKKGNETDASEVSNDITIVVGGETVLEPAPAVTYVAYIGTQGFESVSAALDAAYNAGMKDVVITLTGETNASTTDSVDLYSKYDNGSAFNTITFQQEDASKPYYLNTLYTGWTTGKVVFDGVNIIVTGQLYAIGKVELLNNSTITCSSDTTNFVFYGDMVIEPGSKFNSLVDRISSGSSLTVDGGKTNGTINSTADYKTVWLYVEEGNTLTIKNGAYVVASNWEYAELDASGTVDVQASRLDVFTAIKIGANGVFKVDGGSDINTNNITGTGKIVLDAAGLTEGAVAAFDGVNMSGFTGTIEVVNASELSAEIVDGKLTLVEAAVTAVAQIGTTTYPSIQAAVDAAADGDTVVLLDNITLTDDDIFMAGSHKVMANVENKAITLDMNGKTITVDYNGGQYLIAVIRVADGASLTVTGNGGIVIPDNGINVAYMFWKAGTTGALTIENGTYHMDDAGDSMVYTNGDEIVTVNGGKWTIEKIDTRPNQFPCIFNAQGQNTANIIVNGGSYNDDINHQYYPFEVTVAKEKALVEGNDGYWTVVDAVAYVGEKIGEYTHNVGYETIEAAIAAAQPGETVTILEGDHSQDLNINKAITVQGEVADDGYLSTAIWGRVNITADGAAVKGLYVYDDDTAMYINAKNVLVENCELVGAGWAGLYQSYTTGTVTFKDSKIVGSTYGINFDGSANGEIVIDNCVIQGWTSFASTINKVTISDSKFSDEAYYKLLRFYQDAEVTNTTFPAGMRIDSGNGGTGMAGIELKFNDCSMADSSGIEACFPQEVIKQSEVYVDDVLLEPAVAKIGDTYFASLAEAIAAVQTGDNTITLLADCAEDVTIAQTEGVNIVLDGSGKTYSGTITIHGNARYDEAETLTIQNFQFETSEAGHYFIDSNSTGSVERYAHNVTVKACTFTATDAGVNSAAAMRIRQGFDIAIENCTTTNLHSLFQGYGCTGFTAKDVTVDGKNGISVGTSTNVLIENANITATGYGVRADGEGAYDATVKNCTITANDPIVVRKATGAYELTLEGTNTLTGKNANGYGVIFTSGDDGTYTEPTGEFTFDNNGNAVAVYPESIYVAQIGETSYTSLSEAIEKANANDTIVLLANVTENVTIDKNLTIDGAKSETENYTYTGTMTVNTSLTVTIQNIDFVKGCIAEVSGAHGYLTIKNCDFDGVEKSIGYAITVRGGDKLTIENSTAKNYSTGMLYVPSAVAAISVKDVEVSNVAAAFNITYSGDATFENVAFENVTYGIHFQIYGSRTYTVKNSDLSGATNPFWFWDKNNGASTVTVVFEGNNTVPNFQDPIPAGELKLAAGATLTAPEGLTVTTDVKNSTVEYEDGTYVVVTGLAGSGTETDPYLINNADELILFRDSVNAGETKYNAPGVWVALTADIDMNDEIWGRGIGDGIDATYDGSFDGNSYTIKNLNFEAYADSDGYVCGGLFGYTYGAVTIKNLVLDNISVTTNAAGHNVGALVGFANNNGGKLNVSNVTVKNVMLNAPNVYGVGAIVGYSYRAMGTVENCKVDGATITGQRFVGGITGYNYTDAIIIDCTVTNSTITATTFGAGGISGLAASGNKVTDNTVTNTTVTAPENWGYVVGEVAAENVNVVIKDNTADYPQVGGSWVDEEGFVAKVGDKYYISYEAAIEAAFTAAYANNGAKQTVIATADNSIYAELGVWGGIDWTLTSDGTLTIVPTKGTPVADPNCGKTYEVGAWREAVRYDSTGEGVDIEGWPYDRTKVKKLMIEEGVTSIGSFTVQGYTNLTGEVVIPSTVTYIGQEAFQKSTFTKLTFAAGGTEELCIAQGAFKNLIIEEVALPDDRPVHLHAWVFNNCLNLKTAYIPATLVSAHGTNHIDYFKDFNAHSNPTWHYSSEIFAYNKNMESITFGSQNAMNQFYQYNNGTSKDYTVANVGLTTYCDLQAAINAAQTGETVKLIKNVTLTDTLTIPANMDITLDLNGKTISQSKACTESYSMIENKGTLTITGNGKISFTDTGAGDPNFGWGSYTLTNRGTLVVENGTIENLSQQNKDSVKHMYCAIQQSAGTVTINGGTFATSYYRSVRVNGGNLIINGGTFSGQVWIQPNQADTTLTVTGGTFAPAGVDGSSIFLTNEGENKQITDVDISGGIFTTKIGATKPEALSGAITGGLFTEAAKNGTNTALLGNNTFSGEVNEDDYYTVVEKDVAKIGETGFASLAEAITAAQAGDTITFLADITEDVTISKNLTIDGAGKSYTGKMNVTANITIKNVNFDGKGYNGYAVETRSAATVVIENCTAKNYGYGFLQVASNNDTTTLKNVTISDVQYGVKVDYSNGVTLENVDIEASTAGLLNSNYGTKTITIKNSDISILGTWTRNDTTKTTYVFEGANTVDKFVIDEAIDVFKLTIGATLTAPEDITVTANAAGYTVKYENGMYKVVGSVAKIGDTAYASLTSAIAAAQANDTIELLDNVTEDVTVNKSLTIDGADRTYTGTLTISASINLTIDDVNFVDGNIVKGKSTGTSGTYTITNCSFESDSDSVYAVEIRGSGSIIIENCTSEGYFGFLQVPSSNNSISFKEVTIGNTGYAIKVDYSNGVNLENVTITDSTYGFVNSNYGTKTITVKNCSIAATYPLVIWDRNTQKTNTFTFEGNNNFGSNAFYYQTVTEEEMAYTKYVLAEAGATLTAVEGLTVTSTVENSMVDYIDGKYIVVKAVAKIGDVLYETVAEALANAADGATVELLWNEGDAAISMAGNVVGGKTVTITGTAAVDWTKGNLMIGRGGEGDGKVIFDGANITSSVKKNPASTGIHVSGGKGSDANTNYGTLEIKNSTIELDYLINRNATIVDGNSTLTVYGGCWTHGRDASESESGTDETATLTIAAGSIVNVINENGMGVGGEGKGVMIVNGTYNANVLNVSAKGIVNISGSVAITGTATNNGSIVLTDASATLTSSECGGVTTTVVGYEVKYADGKYALAKVELKEFYGSSVTMGNELNLNFFFSKDYVDNTGYAKIVRTYGDGQENEISTVSLSSVNFDGSGKYYQIVYEGIAAKEMCDVLTVTIFDKDGNQISEEKVESVRSYAIRVINHSSQPAEAKTMMVDMLNYGAAAQEYLGYNTSDLANSTLTEAQKALGTQEMRACTNYFSKTNDNYYGTRFVFGNELSLKMYVKKDAIGANGYVVVTYTNHLGQEKSATINTSTLNGSYYEFPVNEIVVADGRCLLTCKFYKADGTEVVTVTESLESHVARGKSTYSWLEQVMNFSDSAYAYLHRNDK